MTHNGIKTNVTEKRVLGKAHVTIKEHVTNVVSVLNLTGLWSKELSSTVRIQARKCETEGCLGTLIFRDWRLL
jgi:hypothetical protein